MEQQLIELMKEGVGLLWAFKIWAYIGLGIFPVLAILKIIQALLKD